VHGDSLSVLTATSMFVQLMRALTHLHSTGSVLQCVAVRCSVLQCVAVCCRES